MRTIADALISRAKRLARLVELGAPLNILESEFWMVMESMTALRRERTQKEQEKYEAKLRAEAETEAMAEHIAAFPGLPWAVTTDSYRADRIDRIYLRKLGID